MEDSKQTQMRQYLNRKKKDPNKFVFTGLNFNLLSIQLFEYSNDFISESQQITPNSIPVLEELPTNSWLNIHGLSSTEEIVEICQKQGIHDLIIQDILDVDQRPKYQDFDNHYFLTVKSAAQSTEGHLTIEQLSFVIGKNYLISFQEHKSDHFEHIRYRLREKVGKLRERGVDYLLFVMLEAIMDNYFSTLRNYEERIDKMQFFDSKAEASPRVLFKLEQYKKDISLIKRNILPIKDFTYMAERQLIPIILPQTKKYFYELQDLCLSVSETAELLQTTLESKTNLFFSFQSHRMNQVMKTLTIVSTIFIPLTFLAGVYGMNFKFMPELKWQYSYPILWGLMITITTFMLIYFRRKKWF